ncbi:linear amide C-N hydrolase [Beduini massiliensis]|uniref:linear amide C-N hydrolase n=1 Tax=Beduini massiliensis TaxID=1585974 RepID=UPI00059AAF2F|nr:choloylglycine hydrolase family protein [Beduini massiliensis]
MCTAIHVKTGFDSIFLGRTMDFSYPLDPHLYVVSKGYEWTNQLNTHTIKTNYTFMGIGQDISPVIFADGVNEMGFGIAVLYFPGYAVYDPIDRQDHQTLSITALEVTKFLLSTCASVEQAAEILRTVRIVGLEDPVTQSVAPLHWIMADKLGKCSVIEKTKQGLQIMDNPIGVLANSPDFLWHMTNLRNYMNVTPTQMEAIKWNSFSLTPFGQGAGTFGLPGDYTPPSRFVRAAFQKSHVNYSNNPKEAVIACFHVMETVSIPKGVVMTKRQTSDYTQYTAFMDLTTSQYFFKTYDNSEIVSVQMPLYSKNHGQIISLGKLNRPIHFKH